MQRRRFKLCSYSLAAVILLAATAFGQQGNVLQLRFPGMPTGGCAPIMVAVNNATGDFYDCGPGSVWRIVGPGPGGITGSGTINTLPRFTGPTTLGDSLATDDGTTFTYTGTGGITTNGTSGLLNLTCSATTPVAAGDIRCVTGTPNSLQFYNGVVAASVSPRTSLASFEGVCQAAANASFSFDTAAANAPAAACITGANVLARAVLDFDAAADESVYGSFWLPPDWTGAIDVDVEAQANEASAASARLGVQTSCIDDSEAYDAALNATQLWSWTGDGTANHRIISSKTGLTLTGCSAGDRFFFRFYRDADASGGGTDDLAVDLRVVAVRFTTRRP